MADRSEHAAAFDEVAGLLHTAAAANARALHAHRGTAAGHTVERQLEHTLDRLALLHGRGTYENLSTEEILEAALENELRLAHALEEEEAAAAAAARAQSLVDAARRGVGLHVTHATPPLRLLRGAYVEPLRPEVELMLWQEREPYLRWRDGAVVVLSEEDIEALRAAGDEVDVLFLDPDELLDLDGAGEPRALEAELERRLTAARAAPDRVGDSTAHFVRRRLLHQSTVLRNLRDRLAGDHPGAHAALLPVIAEHRAQLETSLAAAPPEGEDPLGATIDAERRLQTLVTPWPAEPEDPAGVRGRLQAVADAGTHLTELESHHS